MVWRKNNGSNGNNISGELAERLAQQWLVQQGLKLVEKNYRCKVGELDLVMRDNHTLVFIEVRYRKQNAYGGGLESVDRRKQRKLTLAAEHFLLTNKRFINLPCRFDVMAAGHEHDHPSGALVWHWIKDAFAL